MTVYSRALNGVRRADYLMMNGAARLLLAVARKHEKRALLGTVRKTRELPEGLVENPQGRRWVRLNG